MNSENIIRISIDLETMSLENNAAIVQIGACTIDDPSSVDIHMFNMYINPESSERAGLHVDKGTMEWWSKQDESIRQRVFSGTQSIEFALTSFTGWIGTLCDQDFSRIRFYSKGAEDIIWLKSAFYATHGAWPFHYRSPQNLRTLIDAMDFAGVTVPTFLNDTPHDALADAVAQAQSIHWMLNLVKFSQPSKVGGGVPNA